MNEKIQKWIDFHKDKADHELLEDADFRSLATGFFIALGSTIEEADSLYNECIHLGYF